MGVEIIITETADKTLGQLETEDRKRIIDKIKSVREYPEHYLDNLSNIPGYKLRVGDYRVILDWNQDDEVIYVVAILQRKHNYRELSKIKEVWGAWDE